MRQLDMTDAMFVYAEQPARNTQHIGMIFVFEQSEAKQPVTYEALFELYRRRLPLARSFRERLARVPLDLDYPYWVDDAAFDLEFHVRHSSVPKPGTREQFLALANRVMSLPLDMNRPLWEAWFVEGLDAMDGVPPGSFALFFKMHHAAVDGVSGMEMITAILEDEATAKALMPKKAKKPEKPPEARELLMKAIGSSLSSPIKLADALFKAVPAMVDARRKVSSGAAVKPAKTKAPKTRFNATVTPHKVIDGRSFAFAEVKAIKDAVPGATVNDVVVGVVGGALRRYLGSKKELPKQSLVITVPISLRTEVQKGKGGNQIAMTFVSGHTDVADPLARIAAVGKSMRAIKDYNRAVDAQTLQKTTAAMPGMLMGLASRAMYALPLADKIIVSNAVVTNVPGPMTPVTLLGARPVESFGVGPSTDGVGMFHSVLTLAGTLSISCSSCRELMPDPGFYGQCIEESFAEAAAAARDVAAAHAKSKKTSARKPRAKAGQTA